MFTVRKAVIEEIPEIKNLLRETWIATYGKYYSQDTIEEITSSWHNPNLLKQQIQNPECYFAVACNKEKIAGMITARRIENDHTLMIDRLYVLPTFQGQGIGSTLLNKAISTFNGITTIFVDVEEMNINAINFYRKQGFGDYDTSKETIGNKTFKVKEMVKKIH